MKNLTNIPSLRLKPKEKIHKEFEMRSTYLTSLEDLKKYFPYSIV